jgi:hypothetical protein
MVYGQQDGVSVATAWEQPRNGRGSCLAMTEANIRLVRLAQERGREAT